MRAPIPIARLLRHPVKDAESFESSALLVAGGVFVAGLLVAGLTFRGQSLPIAGRGSVGQFVALGAAVAAAFTFMCVRALVNSDNSARQDKGIAFPHVRLRWYDIGALAIAHAVIALLGWLGVADLLAKSFTGALVFTFPAVVLAAAAIAVSAYAVFLSAVSLTPVLVSVVLVVFLTVGSFASMLSATDPLWWQENLSTLGISDDISALAFNLTLIIAGFIITTIAHYATASIPVRNSRELKGRMLVRSALVLIGALLSCVGLFPVDDFYPVHTLAASGMVAIYVVLVLGLSRFIPGTPRVFVLLGYVFVGVIGVLGVLFVRGYYTLTAVELIAFLMIFSWLVVFLRIFATMAEPADAALQGTPRKQRFSREPSS